jgi:hypothetical protein
MVVYVAHTLHHNHSRFGSMAKINRSLCRFERVLLQAVGLLTVPFYNTQQVFYITEVGKPDRLQGPHGSVIVVMVFGQDEKALLSSPLYQNGRALRLSLERRL